MALTASPFLAFAAWQWLSGAAAGGDPWIDFVMYRDAASRWLAGGAFYQPWQLAGPYDVWSQYGAVLYPPPILLLLVPFTTLPLILWIAVPTGIVAGVVVLHRPVAVSWPFIAMGIAWPATMQMIAHGNPVLWAWAALAIGTVRGWPSVFVLLKPTLLPFAIVGIRHRSWWVALCAATALSILFLPMWPDWIRAVADGRGTGLLYSAKEVPMMLIPLIAWFGSDRLPDGAHRRRRS
jgi:hypothetical protein